ncbi:MAG: hypothetical protein KGI38_03110 [Thaumarchaeota archaeon]|nr:hypothetical protein [Nitrososphaerota archaeon]
MNSSVAALRARIRPSDWQALTKFFPQSTFDADKKSWLVTSFRGNTIPEPALQEAIAKIVKGLESGNSVGQASAQPPQAQQNSAGMNALEALAAEWELPLDNPNRPTQQGSGWLLPEQVRLVSPVTASIAFYPRGMRCDSCGYYGIYRDVGKLRSLDCPNCKKQRSLRQVSLVFVCERCGAQQELRPVFTSVDRDAHPEFDCKHDGPDGSCTGKLRLNLRREKLTQSRWECNVSERHKDSVIYFCNTCKDPSTGKPLRMRLTPTTAANFRPLVYSVALVNGEKSVDLENIEWSWKFSEDATRSKDQGEALGYFGIKDMMVVDNVISYTAAYGYCTYGPDAQPRLYRQVNPDTNQYEYEAYVTQSEGKALIISLDKLLITKTALQLLAESSKTEGESEIAAKAKSYFRTISKGVDEDEAYGWLVALTREHLDRGSDTRSGGHVPLFELLHSLEHALTYQASLQTGLEEDAFVGKVLISPCAIMIYEQGHVEAGGVEYLYQDKLDEWLLEAIRHTRDCKYESREGCVKCLFIKDPLCHPFIPAELPVQYMFPNQLLSRYALMKLWGIDAPFTAKEEDLTVALEDETEDAAAAEAES